MLTFPPCKINLGLNVLRRRPDGYHDIETCFYPVPLTDILEIVPATALSFTSSGTPIPGDEQNNLCLKAYRLLCTEVPLPAVHIHLHKIIPTGAGLGGGSSDAAHTLRLLNTLFDCGLDKGRLRKLAAELGSDCSFFVGDEPMTGSGRGEILEPASVSLKGKYLVLLNPGLHVSTAEAYAGIAAGPAPLPLQHVLSRPLDSWRTLLQNDFEISLFAKFPLIASLKDALYGLGAVYASMSGSGSSVYGIFDAETSTTGSPCDQYVIWKGNL